MVTEVTTIICQFPHIPALLVDVPEEDQPQGEEREKFWMLVAYELATMVQYATRAVEPQIVLNPFRKAGSQYIWEFYVNDLDLARQNKHNWHGQNTSQWRYAGCILLHNGRVSANH